MSVYIIHLTCILLYICHALSQSVSVSIIYTISECLYQKYIYSQCNHIKYVIYTVSVYTIHVIYAVNEYPVMYTEGAECF